MDAEWGKALGYVLGSVMLGMVAVFAGMPLTSLALERPGTR